MERIAQAVFDGGEPLAPSGAVGDEAWTIGDEGPGAQPRGAAEQDVDVTAVVGELARLPRQEGIVEGAFAQGEVELT
jgi:hypothetical protein